jgi:hypothetical protein
MDTDTLKCCLKTLLHHTSVKQYNVIARDQVSLIDFNIVPLALIINTDILKNPGKHWVAVYAWKQRDKIICDHYDSYGNNLKMYKIELPITLALIIKCTSKIILMFVDFMHLDFCINAAEELP